MNSLILAIVLAFSSFISALYIDQSSSGANHFAYLLFGTLPSLGGIGNFRPPQSPQVPQGDSGIDLEQNYPVKDANNDETSLIKS
ncbi:hypothetical protein CONCODRAFT_7801 [Conidiobolus coronatus NRRL 28638]|uniref:Secreted protein n=1 Tax=Conidiobolus coronatus (strain ATCC 28846 / CBS 209.66 / NRRL 28638) TaxID=796925 RepID=A0A137P3X6_CONC2|nr:hypothetical protein CONCODRAFT_7801 [Conidiobolus coronatus NRRL 28638]|eukprot:KXN69717.1 hypothetical protein CONCODRAFT_7801 [Conidiobolus coronatus NRRL 28638]